MNRRNLSCRRGRRHGAVAMSVILVLLALQIVFPVQAQRRITPVKAGSKNITGVNENKQASDTLDRSKLVSITDDMGNEILVDTVSGKEVADTVGAPSQGRVPKMLNPLLFSASVGVDLWDPLMRIFGQDYGVVGFSAELNLHNRYIPVIEAGLGNAHSTPANQNYTYHVGLTPYFRIGANYNFLYNSNPDYQFVAGLRLGWTHFSYELRDVTVNDPYWGESQTVDFPGQTSSVTYLNVLFGLRVKIWKPISMGWNIRFRAILHETEQPGGKPWYIPGYGSRGGILTGSFSVFYTFSLSGRNKKKIDPLPPGFELEPGPDTETPPSSDGSFPPLPSPRDPSSPVKASTSPEPETETSDTLSGGSAR